MYLLKRAGYDITQFGTTLACLPSDDLPKSVKEAYSVFVDHPLNEDREEAVNSYIPTIEKEFQSKYAVEEKSFSHRASKFVSRRMDSVWAVLNLFV